MTTGTKIFRIIISVLLALTMLFSAFFAVVFCLYIYEEVLGEEYGIYVAGVAVTRLNEEDVFCSGALLDHGAVIVGEIDAVGGIRNQD